MADGIVKEKIPSRPGESTPTGRTEGNTTPPDYTKWVLVVATVFQAVVIGTFALGKSEPGLLNAKAETRFEALVEAQDEFIKTLRIERERVLKRQRPRPGATCSSQISETVDQLVEQVRARTKDYVRDQLRKAVLSDNKSKRITSLRGTEPGIRADEPQRSHNPGDCFN
jgi:hypothetical protein